MRKGFEPAAAAIDHNYTEQFAVVNKLSLSLLSLLFYDDLVFRSADHCMGMNEIETAARLNSPVSTNNMM